MPILARRAKEATLFALQKGRPVEAQAPPAASGTNVTAGMTFLQPPALPGTGLIPPAAVTLWGFMQQPGTMVPQFGVNSALATLGAGFDGFSTEGFLDVHKNLGFECSLHASPSGALSGDVEMEAVVPVTAAALGAIPVTVRYRVSMQHASSQLAVDHSTKISAPVGKEAGVARLHVRQGPRGSEGPVVSVELSEKDSKQRSSNGKAPQLGGQSRKENAVQSDCEDAPRRAPSRMPNLKVELQPAIRGSAPGTDGGVDVRWRQAWTPVVRTSAAFVSSSGKMQLDARARVHPELHVDGGVSVGVRGAGLQQASAKLTWKERRRARQAMHSVQAEARFAHGVGIVHGVKFRRKPAGRGGAQADVSLQFKPKAPHPALQFDVFLPL